MKKLAFFILPFLLVLSFSASSWAQQRVTPSDRVTNNINIRQEPSGKSQSVGKLFKGQSLEFIESVPRWYKVRLEAGGIGFVSKSWSTLVTGLLPREFDELRIHFLNIGTGTCTVVECPGENASPMIIDCGSLAEGANGLNEDQVKKRIKELLDKHTAKPNVVFSHGDKDHYSLIPLVLNDIQAQHIWLGGDEDNYKGEFPNWLATQTTGGAVVHKELPLNWHNGGSSLESELSCGLASTFVLTVNSGSTKNGNSLVLSIDYGDFTAIFTGDAVGVTETKAMQNFSGALKATILTGSHHGASTKRSNHADWVEATSPNVVIYSSGEKYGHPRCKATRRYEPILAVTRLHPTQCGNSNSYKDRTISSTNRAQYVTDINGTIVVTSKGSSPLSLHCESESGCDVKIPY